MGKHGIKLLKLFSSTVLPDLFFMAQAWTNMVKWSTQTGMWSYPHLLASRCIYSIDTSSSGADLWYYPHRSDVGHWYFLLYIWAFSSHISLDVPFSWRDNRGVLGLSELLFGPKMTLVIMQKPKSKGVQLSPLVHEISHTSWTSPPNHVEKQ